MRSVMQRRAGPEAPWDVDDGRLLRFEIRANAFCHQMVRSIVGTLVDVGAGKTAAGDLPAILAAARPWRGRPGGSAARPDAVGGRLLTTDARPRR